MFEDAGVFHRIGEGTDVVSKEMYDFEDKGGRTLALRPEQTASVCRAFAQHRPQTPWKVWYAGPNFRYERSQAGRYRQFDQVGVEVLGSDDPEVDVEVISLAWDFYRALGLTRVSLLVNSLGEGEERQRYEAELTAYLGRRRDSLSESARATMERNPLRVLDSKRPEDAAVVAEAPTMSEFLGSSSRRHFESVLGGLDSVGVPWVRSERLVRGLDYYRRTTFEFVSDSLESAQNAVGGGGRYDGLVADLGGPATGGIGFALGLDRTLLACDSEGVFGTTEGTVSVFVVDTAGSSGALSLTHALRRAGVSADRAFDGKSMKSQMKAADRSGAAYAVLIGPDEQSAGTCIVRDMADGTQTTCRIDEAVPTLRAMLDRRPATSTAPSTKKEAP